AGAGGDRPLSPTGLDGARKRFARGTPMESLPDNAAHILVVDDDQRIRDLLARYLFENGFRVTAAGDAATARATMAGLVFDVVILDVMMPGENGIDLARDLKST